MNLLVFDSSTPVGCVAVYSEGVVKAELTVSVQRTHSEHLMPAVAEVVKSAGLAPSDLEAIGVGIGPGSYTGIRIAAGTAMGLGYALDVPVIGISTLEILAMAVWPAPTLVAALLEARTDEVYCALYRCQIQQPYLGPQGGPQVLAVRDLPSLMPPGEVLMVGGGAARHQALLAELFANRASFAAPQFAHPQASCLAILAEERLRAGCDSQVFNLKPLYVRRPYVD